MEIENSNCKVFETNPLLGVANFLSAANQGRYTKNGVEEPGAEKMQRCLGPFLKSLIKS